ncbi:carbohydrate-binding protein [Dactylosporangium sp. CA-052675]|uniref:carbohydrate-binding protein n=1 Tax=Dactylosporangium sp. CA-052675 TaxID=3239927 RepID=UPI003D906A58
MKRKTLIPLALTAAATLGATTLGVINAQSASAALTSNWYASAPYLMPFDNSPPDAIAVMNATGQKAFQLAFILAPNGGGCTPTWDGTRPVSSDTEAAALISRIRAAGGDVSVSIGGYGGTKLGQTCGTPAATAAAYQQVVTKYSLKAIDFDLEEPEYENAAAVNNELGAAQILQRDNPGLYVSVTTAGTAAGTGWFGTEMLKNAKSLGFTPNNYSIMPFDGGFNGASSQTAAAEAFHGILMSTFGWDSATAYAHEGVSLMNGRSDAGEYFRQADFQTVLDYATSHHLARYTYWSVNRDRQCADPNQSTTSGTCSSVPQTAWEFTKYTARFAGATPPTTNPTTGGPPPTTPGTGTCTAAAWNSGTAYSGGALVSYNGHTYKAAWWTQGETPGTASVWVDQGACGGGGTTQPPTCPAAWNSGTAYSGGATVSYGGHKWTAKWWTQGDIPGNNSQNVWTDNGAC